MAMLCSSTMLASNEGKFRGSVHHLNLSRTLTTFKTRLKTYVCFSFLLNLKYIALSKKDKIILCLCFLLLIYFITLFYCMFALAFW